MPPAPVPPSPPADLVVFGGTGDLALRKLLPALFLREAEGGLAEGTRIIAVSRDGLDDAGFRDKAGEAVRDSPAVLRAGTGSPALLRRFAARLHHVALDLDQPGGGWEQLAGLLGSSGARGRVFYLALPATLFGRVCTELAAHGLAEGARVVLEKPLGRDGRSARAANEAVGAVFPEESVFRIDHYLGKEAVQNLLALRFANMFLEPLWNRQWIDHVQITAAETVGVGARRGYYDSYGALRDMVQNHLLQLLCLTAMEPPAAFDRDAVRDAKVAVLSALAPLEGAAARRAAVRGQYTAGTVNGRPVPGYADEPGAQGPSRTETYVALEARVDTPRWAGVPFYLRTGKRLGRAFSEIAVQFRPVQNAVFPGQPAAPNRLVIRLQPEETVHLHLLAKEPGAGPLLLRPAPLELSLADSFAVRSPDAYERLLRDVLAGDPTLFVRRDEIDAAWAWTDPVIAAVEGTAPEPYLAGSAGPAGAAALLARTGRTWNT